VEVRRFEMAEKHNLQMMDRKLIVDTDITLLNDDAQALLILAAFGVIPSGITTVGGNLMSPLSARLVIWLYQEIGVIPPEVIVGANIPLKHKRLKKYNRQHGYWGTDTYLQSPFELPELSGKNKRETGHRFIIEQSIKHQTIDLLCLGPLTNIALALKDDAGLVDRLGRVVIMGGVDLASPPLKGNVTANAEFNFWVDPHAANIVLNSGIRCELITMNTTLPYHFTAKDVNNFTQLNNPLGEAFREVYGQFVSRYPDYSLPMYDQLAALVYLQPNLFKSERFEVQVSCDPSTWGMCKVNPGNNCDKNETSSQHTLIFSSFQFEEINNILSNYHQKFKYLNKEKMKNEKANL
jgi:inosine-uridine nucleoside N-ribohydrolase